MTTTSAGNGDGGDDGEWSWFAPVQKSTHQESPVPSEESAPSGPPPDVEAAGAWSAGRSQGPSRPVAAIRPVRSGADREAARRQVDGVVDPYPQQHGDAPPEAAPPVGGARGGEAGGGAAPQQTTGGSAAVGATGAGLKLVDQHDTALLRATLDEMEPVADSATAYFYAMLFVEYPHLRELFPISMDTQRDRIFRALLTSARLMDDPNVLLQYLSGLGRGHRKYGTLPEHYPAVGECLLAALSQYAPLTWSDDAEAAWVRAYTRISQIMIDAAAEDEKHAPAWWEAEIVGHETRTPGIAVLTVRPDRPYAFRAGQHASVETPWWPRVWRHYSFASAPRADGLLSFHVKAVPAGWVSSALVQRAQPGDVIRLGPPTGSMTVDHTTDSGLLCLGGGTGIAPIKALVEDVAEYGRPRPVEVFYGARRDHDLYDLDTMLGLAARHPWLSVRPVVSEARYVAEGPLAAGSGAAVGRGEPLTGQLPDVVLQYGPWSRYDGYLSGPPGMVRVAAEVLRGAGIPAGRIRHDSIEELAAAAR